MMLPPSVMLNTNTSYEIRAVLKACVVHDIPVTRVEIANLSEHAAQLQARSVLPVGSVAYLQACMAVAGIAEPDNLTYHPSVRPYLGRRVYSWTAGELKAVPIPRPIFVKPARTKLFTGFILVPGKALSDYDTDVQEDFAAYLACREDEELWTSENKPFQSEWRYYVSDGQSTGFCRYDRDGSETAPAPDAVVVNRTIDAVWSALGHPFAIDIGVYAGSGKTGVVELNDAWALGLYASGYGAPTPEAYTRLLWARWKSLPTLPT